ncbi:non-specific lipid transfer protein GPI-anchored 21 [Elaeis guineensis]|uniref:Non-specific lipid transfer protein GPI-anchored 2 n=1 Tax=Elaeis guineensis var. tenera TaxID=51953 RepID=A0A6I9S5T2_ELAGV|nr:non-specific lipid transfer protein GPI-anchored 2 [Elaeis guineensis]
MEKIKCFGIAVSILAAILTAPVTPVTGQIAEACTDSISSFTPCLKFLLGTAIGGNSPTKECCSALEALLGLRMDCTCLILTGNVPFNFPFNRTLALSLPGTCGLMSVPLQCKGTAMTLPGPGPVPATPSLLPLPPLRSEPSPPLPSPSSHLMPASPPQRSDQVLPRRGLFRGAGPLCC